jgi:DNA-directed RNA polymerase specialized sigma24 family protein
MLRRGLLLRRELTFNKGPAMNAHEASQQTSVTQQIVNLLAREQPSLAQFRLSEYFFGRLVQAIDKQFRLRGKATAEDVANSALRIVFEGIDCGRYQNFTHRHDMWMLLLTVAVRKAMNRIRDELRHDGQARREADATVPDSEDCAFLEQLADAAPAPALVAEVEERCQNLLSLLPDDLRQIAEWKLARYDHKEIAGKRGCSVRTIEVKVCRIKSIWKQALHDEPQDDPKAR